MKINRPSQVFFGNQLTMYISDRRTRNRIAGDKSIEPQALAQCSYLTESSTCWPEIPNISSIFNKGVKSSIQGNFFFLFNCGASIESKSLAVSQPAGCGSFGGGTTLLHIRSDSLDIRYLYYNS